MASRVLLIDNYDSFTYNLVYMLQNLGHSPMILPNDCKLKDLQKYDFSHLIISPGPSHPREAGVCLEAIRYFAPSKKILGVCLGHQCIAEAFGGVVSALKSPTHGKFSSLSFVPNPLFDGVKQGIHIALYHSLYVSSLGKCEALGYSAEGVLMVLKAMGYDTYGVQFHPESILQQQGERIVMNFLAM